MKKVAWAIFSASALLVASLLSGDAAGGSVGAHARVGQAAWGGHAPSGAWGHPSSGAWAGRPPSGAWGHPSSGAWGHPPSGSWGGHPPSGGWGHYHGGSSQFYFSGSVVLGPWWPWYPWYPYYPYYSYYPYYPYYPYYAPAPAVAVEQQPQQYADSGEQQADYWYYCQDPQGYYPYVQSCPGGWMKVVPQTAPPQQ